MTDQTLVEEVKTPEELAEEKAQAFADLASWYQKSAALKALREEEMELRNKVTQYFFPNGLKEGVNDCEMPEGWKLKVTGVINRKVNVESIPAITQELAEAQKHLPEEEQVDISEFIKYKPELSITPYKKLIESVKITSGESQEHFKKLLTIFDQVLTITDGSPQVELTEPKKPKAKVAAKVKAV